MTSSEVADVFRVDPATVARWANEGKLRHTRTLGGQFRFPETDIRALLNGGQPDHPTITRFREDLIGEPHTITVERIDVETARARWNRYDYRDHVGELAVVERHHGKLATVCFVESDNISGTPMDTVARATAHTYGATYVEAHEGGSHD